MRTTHNGKRHVCFHGLVLCYANQIEFREDLKVLFEKAAVGGKPITFLFNDNQVGRA